MIKLDFRKASDSICWDSLLKILRHRGFPPKYVAWVKTLLLTGKTAILLNGVPGPWINCKNDLRLGDPLSPYLFIIVADVLQKLIMQACQQNLLQHLLNESIPCPILQYADDTLIYALILIKVSLSAAANLKRILLDFTDATGLQINFAKTTFVPLNIPQEMALHIAQLLNTSVSSFPQTYLGIPLSAHKLPKSDFQPIIDNCDKYLAR
jgi:mannosylglycoprotein endo-beta-mannosidase